MDSCTYPVEATAADNKFGTGACAHEVVAAAHVDGEVLFEPDERVEKPVSRNSSIPEMVFCSRLLRWPGSATPSALMTTCAVAVAGSVTLRSDSADELDDRRRSGLLDGNLVISS